jgi:hypothetical protein
VYCPDANWPQIKTVEHLFESMMRNCGIMRRTLSEWALARGFDFLTEDEQHG